ncbi:MAG: TetR/AcrR family transcriptional regulator [Saccharofermentans sp.]|nr:TetR/AcrR family transcriptional regulator [Saccharofermentans sp.]
MGAAFTEEEQNIIREKLIYAGIDLCREQGLRKMSVSKLTSSAGIAKGSFYNFFDSKESFISAIIDRSRLEIASLLESRLNGRDSMTPHEFSEFYLDYLRSDLALIRYLSDEDRIWLRKNMRDMGFGSRKRSESILREWLSYVDGVDPDIDIGVILNLDHAITLLIGKDDVVDDASLEKSIKLILGLIESYISGNKG